MYLSGWFQSWPYRGGAQIHRQIGERRHRCSIPGLLRSPSAMLAAPFFHDARNVFFAIARGKALFTAVRQQVMPRAIFKLGTESFFDPLIDAHPLLCDRAFDPGQEIIRDVDCTFHVSYYRRSSLPTVFPELQGVPSLSPDQSAARIISQAG